jgi:hypothetical protein
VQTIGAARMRQNFYAFSLFFQSKMLAQLVRQSCARFEKLASKRFV